MKRISKMEKPTSYTQLADSLCLPWREYIGLTAKDCRPLNPMKRICLMAVAENPHVKASDYEQHESK